MKHAHPLVSAQVTTVLFVRSRSGEGGINLEHTRRVSPAKCWCRGNVVQRLPTARIPTLRMIRESWCATHRVGRRDLRRESSARKWRRLHSRGRQSVSKAAKASVMISFSPPVTKWHLFTCSCGMGRQCGMFVDCWWIIEAQLKVNSGFARKDLAAGLELTKRTLMADGRAGDGDYPLLPVQLHPHIIPPATATPYCSC